MLLFINAFCVGFSAWVAYTMFKDGHNKLGWLNVFASGLNLAIIVSSPAGLL